MSEPRTTPVSVDVEREVAITVTWADGHITRFPLRALRRRCPCVRCLSRREAGEEIAVSTDLRVTGAEPVGGFGLGLAWSDGHRTGVYRWERLRAWCGCGECRHQAG